MLTRHDDDDDDDDGDDDDGDGPCLRTVWTTCGTVEPTGCFLSADVSQAE